MSQKNFWKPRFYLYYKIVNLKLSLKLADEQFKKQVLRQLHVLSLKIDNINEDIQVLIKAADKMKQDTTEEEEAILKKLNFPINDPETLKDIDTNFLNASEHASRLVNIYSVYLSSFLHISLVYLIILIEM